MDRQLLGERIRQARDNKGYSQERLAALVGKDQRGISEIEAGARKLPVTDLPRFAEVLGVPILYFFEGHLQTDDLDMALLKVFNQISTLEIKLSVIQIVEVLSSIGEDTFK